MLMTKSEAVFAEVNQLYLASTKSMGKWMRHNHVQWVADKAKKLAKKYNADAEKVYCAALLHDLADCRYDRGHTRFTAWSEAKGKEVLTNSGFSAPDAREIIDVIIRPHSCRPGNLPTTLEGKVLATADAMFHLQTGFFALLCYMNKPDNTKTYEEWQEWFGPKIERDFKIKIFFKDEKEECRKDYESLTRIFNNKTLDNRKS